MQPNTHPMQFDSYPNKTTLRGKWTFEDDDDSWTAVQTYPSTTHRALDASDAGTGLVALTFPPCKNVHIYIPTLDPLVTTQSSQRDCNVVDIDAAAGTATIVIEDKADTQADPVDGSVLSVCLDLEH